MVFEMIQVHYIYCAFIYNLMQLGFTGRWPIPGPEVGNLFREQVLPCMYSLDNLICWLIPVFPPKNLKWCLQC